jgi:hypothetical protein
VRVSQTISWGCGDQSGDQLGVQVNQSGQVTRFRIIYSRLSTCQSQWEEEGFVFNCQNKLFGVIYLGSKSLQVFHPLQTILHLCIPKKDPHFYYQINISKTELYCVEL